MPKQKERKLRPKTLDIHGGSSFVDRELRPLLARTIAFPLGKFENAERRFAGEEEGFIYTGINNPTLDRLERRIASLEGAEACLVTASGMSAIAVVAKHLAHLRGDIPMTDLFCKSVSYIHAHPPLAGTVMSGHIVTSDRLYGGTYHLFRERLPRLGISVSFIHEPHNLECWKSNIFGNTRFLYVETPSNPTIDIFDLAGIARIAKANNIPLVVDSTLATPVLLNPLKLGADIVIHSLSKYMGDGEVIGGAVLGKKVFIDELRQTWFRDFRPCLSPDNAAIFLSHIESLHVRMHEHCRNAERVAAFLKSHGGVVGVWYPTESIDPSRCRQLMPKGFGGLLSFEVKGGREAAKKVLESLRLFWHSVNIGESRSLVIHPATTTHGQLTPEEKARAGITEGMLRLSIGREDYRDLIDDLKQALEKI